MFLPGIKHINVYIFSPMCKTALKSEISVLDLDPVPGGVRSGLPTVCLTQGLHSPPPQPAVWAPQVISLLC